MKMKVNEMTTQQTPTKTYRIVDGHTGKVVATGLSFAGAIRSCDKRDNAYGAYRFRREPEFQLPKPVNAAKALAHAMLFGTFDGLEGEAR